MRLFPERERRGRRLLALALGLSLVVHLVGGSFWARLLRFTHAAPREERIVAQIDPIRIERLPPSPTPTPAPTPAPTPTPPPQLLQGLPVLTKPKTAYAYPQAPRRAVAVAPRALPPKPEPTVAPRKATIHVPPAPSQAYTQAQITALDATFRHTIDQAQQAVAAAPQADHSAPVHGTMKRYDPILNGTVEDVVGGDGVCDPLDDGTVRGPYTYYYLRCTVHYSDGFNETVEFPWPYKFTQADDPFARHDGRHHHFPPQAPPDGFVLPHPFALSRAVCAFYHDECKAVLDREHPDGA
ncbi:MAG: hypothetical protein JOZ86_15765 [Candidatus Eremiobacteraeota bacterium]|nr:hypothetical protein [Candidatus Eremiobacteraeota bacterium]